ncbi:hypothetical protein BURKHO8Y_110142 [Burkholderia sp. 8Y]|uniref:hypothetical protein n=1 Tax=Burkholderia sp. 8Y TaxID=2653133 RepID=UPI0012F25757|nr:hypothetical protein [Burkholderia sp. 8Y]VXB19372.1 hypothetical protein BURKHO8Y_110142 [Burkholderia sp. 8Y]
MRDVQAVCLIVAEFGVPVARRCVATGDHFLALVFVASLARFAFVAGIAFVRLIDALAMLFAFETFVTLGFV